MFLVSIAKLSGKDVICKGGSILGEVKGAEVDSSTWQIPYLQVKLSSQASEELGFKKRFRSSTVCLPVSFVSGVGDVVTVGRTLTELSQTPEISECIE